MEDLRKKIEFTAAQIDAIAALNAAFRECLELGIDFVFDNGIDKVVAVNVADADLQYEEFVDANAVECIAFQPACIEDLDDSDAYKCEVGPEMYYTNDIDQKLYFVNKTNK